MAIGAKLIEKGYGIDLGETTIHSIPADFLLDENLNIIKAHYGKDYSTGHEKFSRQWVHYSYQAMFFYPCQRHYLR